MPSPGKQEASGLDPEVRFPETDPTGNQVSKNTSPFTNDGDGDANSLSSDDEVIGETATSHAVTTATTRRLYDNLQFEKWKRDKLQKQNTHSVSESAAVNEQKSMSWLVREAESANIISSPREYQVELFERAKQKNTIAVLDTGQFTPPRITPTEH